MKFMFNEREIYRKQENVSLKEIAVLAALFIAVVIISL